MRKSLNLFVLIILAILINSCAPSRHYYIDDSKIPPPSKFDFPISEFVENIVLAKKPFPGFNYTFGRGNSGKVTQYIYNVPQLGEIVHVEFYNDPSENIEWSFGIDYPKITPDKLFKPDQITPVLNSIIESIVYKVVSGPLKGACIHDYGRDSYYGGFGTRGDRSIVIFSEPKDKSIGVDGNCE
jgi:hypothetical protein